MVRILVDQSGYELLNLGDVAMLQSCVLRLSRQWPDAEIMVIARSPADLAPYCPAAIAVDRTCGEAFANLLPRRYRPVWQSIAPHLCGRLEISRSQPRMTQPCTALDAVRAADVVVAAGGGYLTDTWRWHATGVLGVLSLAQRLGKPTAMFGQGIGPIRQRMLRVQARSVLPGLAVLGLREGHNGGDLALSLGARPAAVTVTGDDALELIADGEIPGDRMSGHEALGLNMRVTGYAGVDLAAAAAVGGVVAEAAVTLRVPIAALPVSRHEAGADLEAIRDMLLSGHPRVSGHPRAEVILRDLTTPQDLASAAAGCRAIVTGSYHAAVFALAQGVPAVCVTRSAYYDGKFTGLRALFPDTCFVIPLGSPDFADRLRVTIDQAWHLPGPLRTAAIRAAAGLRGAGRDAYAQFRVAVEKTL
jgi:polysaccharide pyruvyl transferase WcaK-like protein